MKKNRISKASNKTELNNWLMRYAEVFQIASKTIE